MREKPAVDMTEYRNAEHALISLAEAVLGRGTGREVRSSMTRELIHQKVTLQRPLERVIAVPGRHNNVFAAIAETIWVLAGRDDIEYLLPYVPRAGKFSDDGSIWRGAYGPRLRNWSGHDQIREVVQQLQADPSTRRAVAIIYDPARDGAPGADIPCTNWLHFMIRDGFLHLEVAVRSNDLFWGFSGINTFEWSVLQEMVARWVGVEVGSCTYYISSLHLYDRHFERADEVAHSSPREPNESNANFATPLQSIDEEISAWFALESRLRSGDFEADVDLSDPLFRDFALMVRSFWIAKSGNVGGARRALETVTSPDLIQGAEDYFRWRYGEVVRPPVRLELDSRGYLRRLHRGKDAAYGDSWKRRGEQIGVMANIARKLDRLERDQSNPQDGEQRLDTVADLAVYSIKYITFVLDGIGGSSEVWSDGPEGFERVLSQLGGSSRGENVWTVFGHLETSIARGEGLAERLPLAEQLALAALELLDQVVQEDRVTATTTFGSLPANLA